MNNKSTKSIFIFLYFIAVLFYSSVSASYEPAHQFTYKIEPWSNFKSNCINVTGTIKGKKTGEYLLRLPAGVASNIKFTTQNEILNYNGSATLGVVNLKYPPDENIHFTYSLCSTNPNRYIDYPIIEKNILQFIAERVLITPNEDLNRKALFGIELSSYPEHFRTITSFNHDQRKFLIQAPTEEFRESIIAHGNMNIDEVKVADKNVYVVSNGGWSYFHQSPSDYVKELVKHQRNFWNDHQFPHYVVFLIKKNPKDPMLRLLTGSHWHNFSMLHLPEDSELRPMVFYTLSHENFHAWIGRKMKVELPQGNLQWFLEGFDDFYGLYFANKSNLISPDEYIKIYNLYIKSYYLSPIKLISNAEINKRFSMAGNFSILAQIRSHFLVKQLRDKYNIGDKNKFDLAMKALFERYQKENWPYLTESRIDTVFKEYIDHQDWDEFKDYILNGKEVSFSATAFAPFAELKQLEVDAPHFGFNMQKFFYEDVIADLEINSPAYKAGLRDGQRVKSSTVDYKITNKPITVVVDEFGFAKEITFVPEVEKRVVPQYVIVRGDVFEKRLRNRRTPPALRAPSFFKGG